MPELPDVLLYRDALERFVGHKALRQLIVRSPFLLRTFDIPSEALAGLTVRAVSRLGKRLVFEFDQQLMVVVHLMIAGRFHWKKAGVLPKGKIDLAAMQFDHGTLMLTEASSQKRAGVWIVRGQTQLASLHTSGLNPLECNLVEFTGALQKSNNTLKRALTDPTRFDGIGNAYSDEILHGARLSPLQLTGRLTEVQCAALHRSTQAILREWIARLRVQAGDKFPEKVTAFRPEMAVHGRFGLPCPVCSSPVQRIRYADNECNYCARCQTRGKLLADRSLSRLLKDDWPKALEE